MKASAIVCAVLAGTFGLSSIASAQSWNGDHGRGHDRGPRAEQRHDGRGDHRHGSGGDHQRWSGAPQARFGHQPRYVYEQPRAFNHPPRYVHAQPGYHRFYRGGYLPYEYRSRPYYVTNWNAYPGLYAPPYGYQWMNVDGQFLLVALATGLITNALVNGY